MQDNNGKAADSTTGKPMILKPLFQTRLFCQKNVFFLKLHSSIRLTTLFTQICFVYQSYDLFVPNLAKLDLEENLVSPLFALH